jgi:hypothetical protein
VICPLVLFASVSVFHTLKILGTKDCTYKIIKFQQIIQSWTRNEDKDVDVGCIEKQLKIHYPI